MSNGLRVPCSDLLVTCKLSHSGEELKSLEYRSQELQLDNQLLQQKLLSQQSLTNIESQAVELGFSTKPEQVILSPDVPVALSIETP